MTPSSPPTCRPGCAGSSPKAAHIGSTRAPALSPTCSLSNANDWPTEPCRGECYPLSRRFSNYCGRAYLARWAQGEEVREDESNCVKGRFFIFFWPYYFLSTP